VVSLFKSVGNVMFTGRGTMLGILLGDKLVDNFWRIHMCFGESVGGCIVFGCGEWDVGKK